ncbi:hypothetical protein [Jeotgalibacillus proteolyticus]|uniref:5,10-methylene-tetrahydrofolate dehydrogenase n=1 Tax=Jeotgalibacillus proteolyticus TaxID=2082395 RepID=A0A2S5G7U7_9BACL|nr:hypothetical protein [Jeotgalibacillus proteolyticus]PPA69062.1 hypothetical protein C4B60_17260 [Jeotgalibacillus proteolyticus]
MSGKINKLGLITAPGYPEKLITEIKDDLPELLSYYVDDQCEWKIELTVDSLTGGTDNSEEVLREVVKFKSKNEWDFTVAITDLPLLKNKKVIIAEALEEECIALISLPGLGAVPLGRRIRDSILQLVNEMTFDSSEEGRAEAEKRLQKKDRENKKNLKNRHPKRLVGRHGFDRLSPIKREAPEENEEHIDVRFKVDSYFGSAIRLLTGMVRANRPWTLFPSFIKVIILAFTTGAYALVFPTLWTLSNEYSPWRMLLLTVISISAMVTWIITAHKLWEKKSSSNQTDYIRNLYNTTTALTLFVSVSLYYSLLFILFSVAVIILIPISLLQSEVSGEVGYINYFYIAWTATSISTIIGALGSALEEEEVVLSSTYGYRQRQRYQYIKDRREKEEETKENE